MKQERKPIIEVLSVKFERIPVKTRILTKDDDMLAIVQEYALPIMQEGDVISISESPLAITQGRAVPVSELKIGLLAKILWRFVAKVPYGIGLRAPSSMQCAIDECGWFRILLAAKLGFLAKLVGIKGVFYRVAGMQAALIDAANTSPVPPYNETVIKGPLHPEKEAQKIADAIGYQVAVMDINDIGGCWMIGASKGLSKNFMEMVMKDNPQGQSDELTPICIVRRVK
jgi:F420-0:gamma-glutamyl ligase